MVALRVTVLAQKFLIAVFAPLLFVRLHRLRRLHFRDLRRRLFLYLHFLRFGAILGRAAAGRRYFDGRLLLTRYIAQVFRHALHALRCHYLFSGGRRAVLQFLQPLCESLRGFLIKISARRSHLVVVLLLQKCHRILVLFPFPRAHAVARRRAPFHKVAKLPGTQRRFHEDEHEAKAEGGRDALVLARAESVHQLLQLYDRRTREWRLKLGHLCVVPIFVRGIVVGIISVRTIVTNTIVIVLLNVLFPINVLFLIALIRTRTPVHRSACICNTEIRQRRFHALTFTRRPGLLASALLAPLATPLAFPSPRYASMYGPRDARVCALLDPRHPVRRPV